MCIVLLVTVLLRLERETKRETEREKERESERYREVLHKYNIVLYNIILGKIEDCKNTVL